MSWSIELLPRVEREVAEAVDWYEARREGLGRRLLDELDATLQRVTDGPSRFPRWQDDARYQRALLSRFPFVVMFVAEPATFVVTVVAVAHMSRNPNYWR